MDKTTKGLMIIQPRSTEEKLKLLMDNVSWGINHRGLVPEDGIFNQLKDIWDICNYSTKNEINSDNVLLPKELTAENGAKSLLIGEFHEETRVKNPNWCAESCESGRPDCSACEEVEDWEKEEYFIKKVPVSWSTIKDIYKMIVSNLAKKDENKDEIAARIYELESLMKKYIKDYKSTDKRKISYIAGYYCDEFEEILK